MLAIIGTVGVPACYGGFETLVDNLLDSDDELVLVYCSSNYYTEQLTQYKNAKLIYIPIKANGVQSILYDGVSLLDAVFRKKCTCVLALGVSGAVFLPFVKLFSSASIITNIDGLEWRRDKWNKIAKWFLKFSETIAVKLSDVVISDNQAIAEYVKREYDVYSEVIAYGGDHAVLITENELDKDHSDSEYALSICRIEPENNVHVILEAFDKAKYNLKFIGNWNNSDYGRELKLKYSNTPNIDLVDPIYDVSKLFDIRCRCSFYVHGHSAGGTNPSLVEMMHFAKPIIAFDCEYNKATTESSASFFSDADSLVKIIKKENWTLFNDQGPLLKQIANERYTWKIIKSQYFGLVNKLTRSSPI